ncbi:hypothetical protein [Streptomyces sp. NPDC048410]|uniref:hypothetical protein n=1 Tax=Streptomyces sp. NPDC048410 TaxID=3365545 RepID=UPI00371E21DA
MADEVVHVLLTDYGQYGWGVTSPQLPELVGGRESYKELRDDLDDILAFGGVPEGAKVIVHRQKYAVDPGGEHACFIRIANDEVEFDRIEAAMRLAGVLNDPAQRTRIMSGPSISTGERLFICAVPGDTLRWLSDQLVTGEVASIITSLADDMLGGKLIREMPIAHGCEGDEPDEEWHSLSESGLTPDSTLGDLIMAVDAGRVSDDALLVTC